MKKLDDSQKRLIRKHIEGYSTFAKTDQGRTWLRERSERKERMQSLLGPQAIATLTEDGLRGIIKDLWATGFWGNKDYKASNVLDRNSTTSKTGSETIRDALSELLYGPAEFALRYDTFRNGVKGLGPSSISEILLFVAPTTYCLWNDKPQCVLPRLGLEDLLPNRAFKYPNAMTGKDYVECCEVIGLLRDELRAAGIASPDYTDADCFLWYLFDQVFSLRNAEPPPPEPPKLEPSTALINHSNVQAILLKLGNLLGYDTYVADPSMLSGDEKLGDLASLKQLPQFTYPAIVDTARYIDVIWFNEEFPYCCFEIEHTTDVTKGLLRLYQIRQLEHVRFYIIAPAERLNKFHAEVSKDPFNRFKTRYTFQSYEQLSDFYDLAKRYHEKADAFGIVRQ
jgi:hypothetical protein